MNFVEFIKKQMELTTNNPLSRLPQNYSDLASLRIGHKQLKDLGERQVMAECANILKRAFLYNSPNGQTDEQIIAFQTLELFNVLKKFKLLTLPEVSKAFDIGLNNGYGQYFGMCGKTYHQFISGFYNSESRGKAWLAYLEEVEKPDPVKHKFMPEREERTGCVNLFKRYKESGHMEQLSYAYYDTFCKYWGRDYKNMEDKVIKTICWDKEARINIFKRSMSEAVNELKVQRAKLVSLGDLVQAEVIDLQFKKGLDDLAIMKHRQKKYMLQWFFEELIREGVEL